LNFLKTTFFSGVITVVRVLSGFVANKVVAIYTGPTGIALIGSFTNFISITLAFANGAINSGIVKYSSEYLNDDSKTKDLLNTALKISLFCSFFVGLIITLFSKSISILLFKSDNFSTIIVLFGLTIFLYSLNILLLSILNGRGEIKKYTLINTLGSIFSLLITLILVYYYNIQGAMAALFLSQTSVFFIAFYFCRKSTWYNFIDIKSGISNEILKKLSHYSIMAIVSAILVPLSQMIIREYIITTQSINAAGLWQGILRISDAYLMIITTSLSVYYLPKLASLKTRIEIQKEILKVYKYLVPFLILSSIIMYYFRSNIVNILFSVEFKEMKNILPFQLLGDSFKMISWVLAYLLIAKSWIKKFILLEIFFNVFLVSLTILLIKYNGLIGTTFAYILNYIIYTFVLLLIISKSLNKLEVNDENNF